MANFYIGIGFNSDNDRKENHTLIKTADNKKRDIKISTINLMAKTKEEIIKALVIEFEDKVRKMI